MSKFKSQSDAAQGRFKVGDRVVTYEPNVISEEYAGIVGVISSTRFCPDGTVNITYPDGVNQVCYPEDDKLQYAPEVESPNVDAFDVVSKPDGGPAGYYDLPTDRPMNTLNDILEWKGDTQWLGDSFHLANVTKGGWRWGIKDGTSKAYDSRKFVYSGARLLMKYAGVSELRKTLQKMLDDPQFKETKE
tara:strand:+ start:28976 stop:29542 length:567 start_codon:yes stop_codon:yes gene_type:complete